MSYFYDHAYYPSRNLGAFTSDDHFGGSERFQEVLHKNRIATMRNAASDLRVKPNRRESGRFIEGT